MLLVEEGKLSLDDKIGKYLTEVPESWKRHHSEAPVNPYVGHGRLPSDLRFAPRSHRGRILQGHKVCSAQHTHRARNGITAILDYVTLGILIHKVTGKFYGDFLAESIFKPLGMTSTRVISEADIVPNRAAGYRLVNNELKNQEWVSPSTNSTADGSLYFTVLIWLNGMRLFTQTGHSSNPPSLRSGLPQP